MFRRLYETLTGRPWTTTRSAAAEFGPPPGARYATELAAYTDTELITHGAHILAQLHAHHHRGGPAGHRHHPMPQHRTQAEGPRPRLAGPRPAGERRAAAPTPAARRRPAVAGGGR